MSSRRDDGAAIRVGRRGRWSDEEELAILKETTQPGPIMAVGQLSLGQRIVLGAIKGDLVRLEQRTFDLDDYTNALSSRRDSGNKQAETTVNLASGPQNASLGGGSFPFQIVSQKVV